MSMKNAGEQKAAKYCGVALVFAEMRLCLELLRLLDDVRAFKAQYLTL